MTVTKVLGAQPGVQYQGVQDKSEADPSVQLLNGVIAGQFKRGRFDKPFKVTQENIRAKLGYEPKNREYVAVEDALSSGVPSVWVQRVSASGSDDSTGEVPEITYTLTIDDKGMLPADGIYSGTIEPPLPGISLGFNIQQYTPNGSNGRVFNIYSDPTGLIVNEDGSSWSIDKNIIHHSWGFPTESSFKTPATYQLTVREFFGNGPTVAPGILDYVVSEPVITGKTDFPFQTVANTNLGRFSSITFMLEKSENDALLYRIDCTFGFYTLSRSGTVSDLVAAYNSGLGELIINDATYGMPEEELTDANIRKIFQMSVVDDTRYFHYRGARSGKFIGSMNGTQNTAIITASTPLAAWTV